MLINKSLIDDLSEGVVYELEKAIPGMPKLPKPGKIGGQPDLDKKKVGDIVQRHGKDYRITAINPTKTGWGRFKLEAVTKKPEDEAAKREARPEETGKPTAIKQMGQQVKDLYSKVKEKLGEKQKPTVTPPKEKPKERPMIPKTSAEVQQADINTLKGTMDYLSNLENKMNATKTSPELAKLKQDVVDNYIVKMRDKLKQKMGSRFVEYKPTGKPGAAAAAVSYEDLQNKVKQYEDKMSAGQYLDPLENKEYKRMSKQLNDIEDNRIKAMQAANQKMMQEERAKKAKEFGEKLARGEKPFPERTDKHKIEEVKLTDKDKQEDLSTFVMTRYRDDTGKSYSLDQVQANNKKVVDSFVKQNGLKIPKDSINYVKGEIRIPFNSKTIKEISGTLKENYGSTDNDYISFEKGTPGEDSILKIKKVGGINWEIKPLPEQSLADSINTVSDMYDKQAKSGKRKEYRFLFAPDQALFNPPDSPEGQSMTFIQGGMRSGKGLMFGTMMNQALGSADGSVVKFYNFDPTGAFWNDMKDVNPNVIKQMDKKGLVGHNGVATDNIVKMPPDKQASAVKSYVDNFVNKYNEVYSERAAMMEHYGVGHIGKIKDQQIPQAVFNFDEMQQFEGIIQKNTALSKGEKKELLNKITGVMASQKTTGKKLGITMNVVCQNGFDSDQMTSISGAAGNHLLSLDGKADLRSFGSARGFTSAVTRANIGNAIVAETRKPDQNPRLLNPIVPGVGTATALKGK